MIAALGHLGEWGCWLTIEAFVYPIILLTFTAIRWLLLSFYGSFIKERVPNFRLSCPSPSFQADLA
jgi:hypothetical protein